jgi:L-lactate dehydrogenase complex protein LldG
MNSASTSLVESFVAAAEGVAATVERIRRAPEEVAAAIKRAAPDAIKLAIAKPHRLPAELFSACLALPGVFETRGRHELAAADVGVTEAFAGVAHSGSVCIELTAGDAAYVSLLPRMHIAVLAAETIVERPGDLFGATPGAGAIGLEKDFVFVTGPSATADMGPLVRGVHGPHRLHILILE